MEMKKCVAGKKRRRWETESTNGERESKAKKKMMNGETKEEEQKKTNASKVTRGARPPLSFRRLLSISPRKRVRYRIHRNKWSITISFEKVLKKSDTRVGWRFRFLLLIFAVVAIYQKRASCYWPSRVR